VFGATAVELPGSDLQTRSNPITLAGRAREPKPGGGFAMLLRRVARQLRFPVDKRVATQRRARSI
jgi:hypothetical protein